MKKLLLIVALSLTLAACGGNKSTQLSDGKEVLFSVGTAELTTNDIYTTLVSRDSAQTLINTASKMVFDLEAPMDDEMLAEAEESKQEFIDYTGEYIDAYLSYYGFNNIDQYYEEIIKPTVQQTKLIDKFLEENKDSYVDRYQPKLIRMVEFTDESVAAQALAELNAGSTDMESVATNYGNQRYDGSEMLIHTESSLSTPVLDYIQSVLLSSNTNNGYSEVLEDTSSYFIVEVVSLDSPALFEQLKPTLYGNTTLVNEMMTHYFNKYQFRVYDKTVYDIMKEAYPDYLNQ